MPSKKAIERAKKLNRCLSCCSPKPEREPQSGQQKCGICCIKRQFQQKQYNIKNKIALLEKGKQRRLLRRQNNQCTKCGRDLDVDEDQNYKCCSWCRSHVTKSFHSNVKSFDQYNHILEEIVNDITNSDNA